jgi:phosphoglucomutase/phosphomannomutase
MDKAAFLARAAAGFRGAKVKEEYLDTALRNLERWLQDPQFAAALPQLERLLEKPDALFDAFFREIPFGTGGRRGPVGYGTNRFNHFTLATSIQGHAEFLRRRFPGSRDLSVVVAYDVRRFADLRGVYDRGRPNALLGMTSKDFAEIAASVYSANGVRVWMPDPEGGAYLSTPELSFAIIREKASGGLNISASHNHPDDNGAKIYNSHGGQEVPPVDEDLATIVEKTTSAESMPFETAVARGLVRWLAPEVHEAYLEMNRQVSRDGALRSARIVFTPLHGTGFHSAGAALQRAGFDVEVYPDQAEPDGAFPSVPFRSPNPEVPQSLLGAKEHARKRGADLVLGTDPDADRLGMMAPHAGEWVFFTGNEIGIILINYLLSHGERPKAGRRPFVVTTVVTTSLFGRMAKARGVQVLDDLGVGFKYIAEVLSAIEEKGTFRHLRARPEDFLIAIEESHGYLVVPHVRDKDAAGAAVLLGEIASLLKDSGRSFVDYLDEAYREFGYVRNALVSTVMLGASGFVRMRQIQDRLRESPPAAIGGRKVLELTDRWDESGPWGKIQSATDRLSRDLLTFRLEGGARLTLRPSGTESKNKIYVEVCGEPLGKDATDGALARDKERIDAAARDLARSFTREMLSTVDISLPDYALDVSDLVALEWKQDFAEKFLPELIARVERGGSEGERGALGAWIDRRLSPYGADARLLVAGAVRSYLDLEPPPPRVREALVEAFSLAGASREDPSGR